LATTGDGLLQLGLDALVRHLAGEQHLEVVAGDVDVHLVAELLVDAVERADSMASSAR
jgi:hypothetical protein